MKTTFHALMIASLVVAGWISPGFSAGEGKAEFSYEKEGIKLPDLYGTISDKEYIDRAGTIFKAAPYPELAMYRDSEILLGIVKPILLSKLSVASRDWRWLLEEKATYAFFLRVESITKIQNAEHYRERRKQYADTLVGLLREIDKAIIGGYKKQAYLINIMPPVCPGLCFPGMSMDAMPNEDAKKAYQDAIDDHNRKLKNDSYQRILRTTMRRVQPDVIAWITRQYTTREKDIAAMNRYLTEIAEMNNGDPLPEQLLPPGMVVR